jgi:hypothetical protein
MEHAGACTPEDWRELLGGLRRGGVYFRGFERTGA